jgi:PAS domain S-box-containing protein
MSKKTKMEQFDLNMEDVIVVFVRNDEIVEDINQKGRELLGYSKDGVVGKNWFDNFIPKTSREQESFFSSIAKRNIS